MSYTLNYKTDSSLVSHISMPSAVVYSGISYTYDEFDRLTRKKVSYSTLRDFYTDYEYYTYTKTVDEELKTFTTALVSKLTLSVSSNGTAETVEYGYTYDKLGNILKITKNSTVINEYEYDALGQLVCEEYPVDNLAYVYTYDKAGNITGKYEFPYYQGTLAGDYLNYLTQYKVTLGSYTYSTSAWGDMLTNYNGTAITYDAIGNPNNWRNAASMSWDKRELTSLTLNDNGTLNFVYNSDGIRTQKTYINGETTTVHNYVLDGTNAIYETVTENGVDKYTLYYLYDSSGIITGFIYNNNPFYFQKNLQGDIVRILNPAGAVVTEYTYDAWGNVLSITGTQATTIGQINPFRYRGYYYDTETGFYYLQSRYYDPAVGRFLNADGIIGANGGILGYNMFAYCSNNPVVGSDPTGECYMGDPMFTVSSGDTYFEEGDYCDSCKRVITATFFNHPYEWSRLALNTNLSSKQIDDLLNSASEDRLQDVVNSAISYGIASVGIEIQITVITIQAAYAVDDDEGDFQFTIGISSGFSLFGIGVVKTVSTVNDVSQLKGAAVSNTQSTPILKTSKYGKVNLNTSLGYMSNGHTSMSVGVSYNYLSFVDSYGIIISYTV